MNADQSESRHFISEQQAVDAVKQAALRDDLQIGYSHLSSAAEGGHPTWIILVYAEGEDGMVAAGDHSVYYVSAVTGEVTRIIPGR